MNRRRFIGTVAAPLLVAPALIGMSRKAPRRIVGGFVDDGGAAGHMIRDGAGATPPSESRRVPILIVGGGMAGLSAGWELDRRGMRDFVILELEQEAGGNARSGQNEISAYPWAAHYVPVPNKETVLVRELFEELGVLRDGQWEERYLCFSPQERLFLYGEWRAGIDPDYGLDARGRADFKRFDEQIAGFRATKEFTVPMTLGVKRDSALDHVSMAEWLRQNGMMSPAMKWSVDYACRDDYGALASETSAWAGIHYFASRSKEERGPLTWPEGNGWIAKRLIAKLQRHIVAGQVVTRIERDGTRWRVTTPRMAWIADDVIFAAPSFLLPYLMPALKGHPSPLVYSPWLTANLSLDRIPKEKGRGAPPSWDNVIYDSPSLGYVVATHQSLRSYEDRTVWTYYWSLAEHSPSEGRRLLLRRSWMEWTDLILADLARAHPDIRDCVSRIDIMRMGHAMVRPSVGFLAATAQVARLERPGLHLANSDLSGLSLFEEAQYRGVTAARNALRRLGGSK